MFQTNVSNKCFKQIFQTNVSLLCNQIEVYTDQHLSSSHMKTLPITFGIALFAIAMISATAFNDASAVTYDGTLAKFTPDGKYKIDMAWSPAGSLEPGVEYDFTFKISQGATDRAINFISIDLGVVENGILTSDNFVTSGTGAITRSLVFDNQGITHILLSNINHSDQEIDFTFSVGENPLGDGLMLNKKMSAEPQIYFCGWEKNKKTLKDCFETETYENYGWYGKVNVLIYAPGWNMEKDEIEWIGDTSDHPVTFHSRSENGFSEVSTACGLIETGTDTGLFMGRLKLTAHDYDMDGDGSDETGLGGIGCSSTSKSPYKELGKLESGRDGAFTVNWQYANDPEDKWVTKTATFHWNLGTINFLQDAYSVNDLIQFKYYDKDVYGMGKSKMALKFKVYSDSDSAGIDILGTQNGNHKFKKPYEFRITTEDASSGETLYALPGDKIYVEYDDHTLPEDPLGKIGGPYTKGDDRTIIAITTLVG